MELSSGGSVSEPLGVLGSAAQEYLAGGLAVIPLQPRGKKPLVAWKQFQNRLPTTDEVDAWWRRWPDANVGLVTGVVSGIVVIDVDGEAGRGALMERGELPSNVAIAHTARGSHLYFTHPGVAVPTRASVLPSVDVRGDGGYIVAPPSTHEGGVEYRWDDGAFMSDFSVNALPQLPPALLELVTRETNASQSPDCDRTFNSPSSMPEVEVAPLAESTQYEPSAALRTVLDGPIAEGQRNDSLAAYVGRLCRVGMTHDEVLHLALRLNTADFSPPLSDSEVAQTVESIWRLAVQEDGAAVDAAHRLADFEEDSGCVRLDHVQVEDVRWLWEGYVPLGKLTLIDGDPGTGKTTMALDLAARVSRGGDMPDGSPAADGGAGGVVILTDEDGIGDTLKPRLLAMGADASRIAVLQDAPSRGGARRSVVFPDDVMLLRHHIRRMSAKLVIVDPLMAFVNRKHSTNNDQEVRHVLGALRTLAAETGAAIVLIRHANKKVDLPLLLRGSGSIGIAGIARMVFAVVKDPEDDERRVLLGLKANLARLPVSWTYRVVESDGGAARVVWEGTSSLTAGELVTGAERKADKLEAATEFLLSALAAGPRESRQVMEEARTRSIKERTLERAYAELRREGKVTPRLPRGQRGRWIMALVTKEAAAA